jgi:CRP/FNR family transcriptional regulator, cyclic AMP receptor protein
MRPILNSKRGRDPSDCSLCATRPSCVAARVPSSELPALQPLIRKSAVRRGHLLAQEGEVPATVRVLKVGSAFAYRLGLDGRSRPVGMMGRGGNFGVSGVYGQSTPVSAVAASATRVCEIPIAALRELTCRDREFADFLQKTAAESCGRMAAWSEAMRVRGITNQLAYALLLLSEAQSTSVIELPTHVALADLLATTRETVARGLSTLEEEGGIRRDRRKQCEVFRSTLLERLNTRRAS